jgi:hypothetical protein
MSLHALFERLRGQDEPLAPQAATHVLYFTPPGCPDYASWYLVPAADWCGDLPPRDWDFLGEIRAERDLSEEYCARFAAEVLGFPVTLTGFQQQIRPHRFGLWSFEPAYYVTPAGGA